ncbi:UvrD-helicase domain-containing protein [Azospirillum sp. sgz302134]
MSDSTHPTPTGEQRAILDAWRSNPNEHLAIVAYAGAGKSSTLKMLARADTRPNLYICFNKNIQTSAEKSFPPSTRCRTSHGLAYRAMGMQEHRERLNGRLFGSDVADLLSIVDDGRLRRSLLGTWVLDTVRRWCNSADPTIDVQHVEGVRPTDPMAGQIAEWARSLWRQITARGSQLPLEHDFYLKSWVLTGPKLSFAYGLFDEAQDANPLLLQLLGMQDFPIIRVGDPFQSIYQFRDAVNAMDQPSPRTLHLSESFRFGPRVAAIARCILANHSRAPKVPLRGNPAIDSDVVGLPEVHAVLCRTNMQLFDEAVMSSGPLHVIGGAEPLLKLIMGGWALYCGDRPKGVPALARFASYGELKDHVDETGDRELELLTKIIARYGGAIPDLCESIDRRHVPERTRATLILSTAHKGKGDEFPAVRLAEDFPTLQDLEAFGRDGLPRYTPAERDAELNLLYVAATRGQLHLQANEAVRSCVARVQAFRQRKQSEAVRAAAAG